MISPLPVNTNPLIDNSFLGSKWFDPSYLFNQGVDFSRGTSDFFANNGDQIASVYNTILFFLALFFMIIISYTMIRMVEIRFKEKKHLRHEILGYAEKEKERARKANEGEAISKNERWVKTLSYLFSQHASDWKLAVVEADLMLETLMDNLGFKGESLGEKLKGATQEKFRNLTAAWEVHTIRNRIAHEGASFELTQREAKRVIAVYEQIFREFGFI